MRVNIYAEEMTERIEIISKEIEGEGKFTGLRFYLELPVTVNKIITRTGLQGNVTKEEKTEQVQGPFKHHPNDDDSAAVTFWGKQDLRKVLTIALAKLDEYYGEPIEKD